jgi:hypothetical protein
VGKNGLVEKVLKFDRSVKVFSRFIKACKAFYFTLITLDQKDPSPSSSISKEKEMNSKELIALEGRSHLYLLSLLQKESRFLDFIYEDLSECSDEKIGGVARILQKEMRSVIDHYVSIDSVIEQAIDSPIILPVEYNRREIQLKGNRSQKKSTIDGRLLHGGYRARKFSLPFESEKKGDLLDGIITPSTILITDSQSPQSSTIP